LDYKYKIHKIAEEIAQKEHEEFFHNLPDEIADEIWSRAETQYFEGLQDQADNLRDEMALQGD